ncbi:hypothetical protein F4779DRAFT_631007 [Xylariaceae sp. FL0662B]|nr:hypothetical protein F4779DRAFT_631007 [Xylariaceae sp. FL0662B]
MLLPALLAFTALVDAAPQTTPVKGPGDNSLIRFGCSQVVIERLDPLVNPGANPSPHLHQNAFNASIPSADVSELASCTTCSFSEDFSNYWTANLYFKARNGTYKRIPQIPNRFLEGSQGGVTVYYLSPGKNTVTAFKPGFRMLVGDSMRREKMGSGLKSQSCFRCFTGPDFQGDNYGPCGDPQLDTETFPSGPCLGGIRSNIHFPTCWDGKTLDSPNHQDHVAYPVGGPSSFATTGECPSTHPVKIPQLMLEIVWDTTAFNDPADWPEDGSQPFVLSTGDSTGYGQHGDYVFGWKGDALQTLMDGACFGNVCEGVKTQEFTEANKCSVANTVDEITEGWLEKLPGDGSGA